MNIREIERKYLNRIVKHKERGWEFEIIMIMPLGEWASEPIEAVFKVYGFTHSCVPPGRPSRATIHELENDYEFIR